MNWATVAPETRLYKGKYLYRWELSPGVHHHCGTCATPLSNPHAKTTCLGIHVEPCYRFHQQLHFVGKSHECFGCNSSDEKHHQRHREILKLVRQVNALDQVSLQVPQSKFGELGRVRRPSLASESSPADTGSESVDNDELHLTRRERKKAKKVGNGPAKDRSYIEVFPKEEVDFISEAIHLFVHESKGAWEGTYVYTHRPQGVQEGPEEIGEVDEFVSFSARMESLAVKSPDAKTPRQRKIMKRVTTPVNFSSFGGGSRKYLPNQENDPYDGVDPDIFLRLGIEVVKPSDTSKARKDIIVKLVVAIKDDLEIIRKEEVESALREEGFWRWAGKQAYDQILHTRTELDWATGQKKGTPRYKSVEEKIEEFDEFDEGIAEDDDPDIEGLELDVDAPVVKPTPDGKQVTKQTIQTPTPNQPTKSKLPALNWDPPPRSAKKTAMSPIFPPSLPATIPGAIPPSSKKTSVSLSTPRSTTSQSSTPRSATPRSVASDHSKVDPEDEWTTVTHKKTSTNAMTAKARLTKSTRFFNSDKEIIKEEGEEDLSEMMSRHKQRTAGGNNIGNVYAPEPSRNLRTSATKSKYARAVSDPK